MSTRTRTAKPQFGSNIVENGRKSGQTWVKGDGDKNPSRHTSLPVYRKVIVVTSEDMKQAEGK